MNTKPCKCKSGLTGWCGELRGQYRSYEEFADYAEIYGLPARLGFDSAEAAWAANPVVEGSVNPADYRLHREAYRLVLPSGSSPRGAQMGRRNVIPALAAGRRNQVKLHLTRLRWVDYDYDQFGAYWGGGSGDYVYCAEGTGVLIFIRACNRKAAKARVREALSSIEVKFYR